MSNTDNDFWNEVWRNTPKELLKIEDAIKKWKDKHSFSKTTELYADTPTKASVEQAEARVMLDVVKDLMRIQEGFESAWAFSQHDNHREAVKAYNEGMLDGLHATANKFFSKLIGNAEVTDRIVLAGSPKGEAATPKHVGPFRKIHVNQHSVGDSGDSFEGVIYTQIAGRWLAIHYKI